MRIALFCHSILSDWNHGNAHFLRGVVTELALAGHDVTTFEPKGAWSVENLVQDHGRGPLDEVRRVYPFIDPVCYDPSDTGRGAWATVLDGYDLVVVHEWNDHALVRELGSLRAKGARWKLLFHDTHHRAITDPGAMGAYDLSAYDGVLAFGAVLRDLYLARKWTKRAWVWHEAADIRVFQPIARAPKESDLVWIGNWGDDERTAELQTFLFEPVAALGLSARVHGVRYPQSARDALRRAGIDYRGYAANYRVPELFGRARVTVHVPRRPYAEALVGIPTIRPFEALACSIPLVCSPWDDREALFTPGRDYLVAKDGPAMVRHLRALLNEPEYAAQIAAHGLATVRARHTCAHRADELLGIARELGIDTSATHASRGRRDSREARDTRNEEATP
jgi:spore maturation protein CgeB